MLKAKNKLKKVWTLPTARKSQTFVKFLKVMAGSLLGILLFVCLRLALAEVNPENTAEAASAEQKTVEIQCSITPLSSPKIPDFSTEIIELTKDKGQSYFVNYRLKREQLREEIKEMLRPLLASELPEIRIEAEKSWLELCHKISREEEIENALILRGYRDVVSEVNAEKITVTVLAEELKFQDIFQITKITAQITGFPEERIEVASKT